MIKDPQFILDLTQGWKYDSNSHPSDLYVFSIKVGGIIVTLLGVLNILIF